MRRVGVIGFGAIGRVVVAELGGGRLPHARLVAVATRTPEPALGDLAVAVDELAGRCDLVVEAAGQHALRDHGPALIAAGVDVVGVSVGALTDPAVHAGVTAGPGRLHVPPGAIGGLDLVRAAALMGPIDTATITSTKRPSTLVQDWMDDAERERLHTATEPLTLYDGPVPELVRLFPTSTNVAAAVALAVGSWEAVRGRVVADPGVELTTHVIEVVGAAGRYRFEVQNQPSPQNPRSSGIVPWSVLATIADLVGDRWSPRRADRSGRNGA